MRTHSFAARLRLIALACLLAASVSGCRGWDPFAFLDYCYLADRTNHHSCISCCTQSGGPPPPQQHP